MSGVSAATRRGLAAVRDYVLEPADPAREPPPPRPPPGPPSVVLSTAVGGAGGAASLAAAVGVATASLDEARAALVVDLDPPERGRGPTVLSSESARELEEWVRAESDAFGAAAARGHICHLPIRLGGEDERLDRLAGLIESDPPSGAAIVHLPASAWADALDHEGIPARAGLIRADLPTDRSLAALAAREMLGRGLRAKVAVRPLGRVASRRALAGIEPGGTASRRTSRLARALVGDAHP